MEPKTFWGDSQGGKLTEQEAIKQLLLSLDKQLLDENWDPDPILATINYSRIENITSSLTVSQILDLPYALTKDPDEYILPFAYSVFHLEKTSEGKESGFLDQTVSPGFIGWLLVTKGKSSGSWDFYFMCINQFCVTLNRKDDNQDPLVQIFEQLSESPSRDTLMALGFLTLSGMLSLVRRYPGIENPFSKGE